MPPDDAKNGDSAGLSPTESPSPEASSSDEPVDVEELFRALRDEVRRSGGDPGTGRRGSARPRRGPGQRRSWLWPVSADHALRLRPGVRGGIGTPVKAVLRKLMRWYVEPLAYDQRSFNAATLRLIDDLQAQVDRLQAELREARGTTEQP